MSRTNNYFDRFINPDDGSRKRKKSQEHKSHKDYKRVSKADIHLILEEELKKKEDDSNI